MPRFMDFHEDLKLPADAIEQIAQGTRDGATDQFGVRQVELYHNADGKVFCLLEGPDEDAVPQAPRGDRRLLRPGAPGRRGAVTPVRPGPGRAGARWAIR